MRIISSIMMPMIALMALGSIFLVVEFSGWWILISPAYAILAMKLYFKNNPQEYVEGGIDEESELALS